MKRLKKLFTYTRCKSYEDKELRLKDLEVIDTNKIDYSYIVYRILGYENSFIDKYIFRSRELRRAYRKAIRLVKKAQAVSPNHKEYINESNIKTPTSIDYTTFMARMEIHAIIDRGVVTTTSDLISHIVAIASFSTMYPKHDYNSNGMRFERLKNQILNQPVDEMIHLYNWIVESLKESSEEWGRRFNAVEVVNEHYEAVSGSQLQSPFNVISTIRDLCNDFNVTYDEAWQLSYAVTQTNSLSKATSRYVQDLMRVRMEAKMKRQRQQTR